MIAIEIFKLFGTIFLKSDEADRTLDRVDNKAKTTGDRFSSMIGTVGKWGLAVGAAAGGVAIALGVKAFNAAEDLQKALNGLQSETGATTEEMKGMRDSMLDIYNNNFGESFEDIGKSMALINQQTGLTNEELADTTKNALAVKDTFGIEVSESIRAVNQLMKDFGIDSEEAYNLIAQGAQSGLNANENLADTINEYSKHFSQLGLNSTEMFNSLVNGAKSGVFDIDKLGDAVKEFGIRSKDGSDSTNEAFEILGLNAKLTGEYFAEGGEKGKEAFEVVAKQLSEIEDPIKQNQIGVSLFGTMWEDVGAKGIIALTNTEGEINKNTDALKEINKIKYNTFGEAITGIGRQFETSVFIPLGEKILPIFNAFANWINENMPIIQEKIKIVMNFIDEKFSFIYTEILPKVIGAFKEWWPQISNIIQNAWIIIKGILKALKIGFEILFPYLKTVIGGLIKTLDGLISFIAGVFSGDWKKAWDGIKNIFVGLFEVFLKNSVESGKDIVRGLWQGINDMGSWIKNKVTGFVEGIGKTIKEFFGISSPSKLMAKYGKNISEGLAKGILDNAQKASDAAQKLSQMVVTKMNDLERATVTALRNRYTKEEKLQTDSLNRQINQVKNSTDVMISRYEEAYKEKLKLIDAETDPKLKALQDEIDNINDLTKAEDEAEEERLYNERVANLRKKMQSEESAEERINIQKELDDVLKEHDKKVKLEERQRRIESIRKEMQDIKENAEEKAEQAKIELEQKKKNEQLQADFTIESLNTQMQATRSHYAILLNEENIQAESRKLILAENNNELIELLKEYNPKWQDAGQGFGESLLEGLNSKKQSIKNAVNEILAMVNSVESVQNKVIAQAQSAWNKARAAGDTEGMATAHSIAVAARAAGGTLGADNPINQYASGTNYIPHDQLALLHEGEAVVPKKYNPMAGGGITVIINNPNLFDDSSADKLGDLLVDRLKILGLGAV